MSETIRVEITSRLSRAAGIRFPMPANYGDWSSSRRAAWCVYANAVNVAIVLQILSLLTRVAYSPDDLGVFCACFVGIGYALNYTLKLVVFTANGGLFARLFAEMKDISRELSDGGDYVAFYDEQYRRIVTTGCVKGGLELFGTVALIVIFIARSLATGVPEGAVTPALSWTPYDKADNPAYSLTCLFELIVYGSVTMRNAVLDLLFWLMLMIPTIQLRYLNHLLDAIINGEDSPEGGARIRRCRSPVNERFIRWVKCHQRILRMVQDFRAITSPFLALNYYTTLVILSLSGLVAISTTSWTIFQQIIINAIVSSNTIQLYIISVTGDWLNEASENAAHGGFSERLFRGGKDLAKNYLFVCARTRHSLEIRFGGINPLSSSTFGQLIRLTMTYLVTIVQLRGNLQL